MLDNNKPTKQTLSKSAHRINVVSRGDDRNMPHFTFIIPCNFDPIQDSPWPAAHIEAIVTCVRV